MYDKGGEFCFIRINDPSLSFRLEYSAKGKFININDRKSRSEIVIPRFDITQYSYSDLEAKIKTYILFS